MDADVVIRNATLATLAGPKGARKAEDAGDVGLRTGHAVAVQDGRITWVGADRDWTGRAQESLDAQGNLVTPGYVDAHAHLVYAGDRAFELPLKLAGRTYMEILQAGGGIMHTVRATRKADAVMLYAEAQVRLRRMLQNGTTTTEAKSGYGLDTATELRILETHRHLRKESGMEVASTFLGAHAVPEEFKGRTDAYVDLVVDQMLPSVARQGEARSCDVFVDEGVFTAEQGERILRKAKSFGMSLRVHADELVETGGAKLAATVGAVSADHLLQVAQGGIDAMAQSGTIATLMPTVPLTLMKPKWAPAKAMLAAGVPIALGSDHNPNNPVTSMGLVGQLGCYALGLSPEQSLTAVTWNAACSLGLEREVGSIEVGKRADLLIHDVADPAHWAYELGRTTVRNVVLGCAPLTAP